MQPGRFVCSCMFKWVSVTFNVQTLRRERRLLEICRAFRSSHFIGLQSTSDRTELGEDSPVYTTKGIFIPVQALGGCDCHPRKHLPASQRQTNQLTTFSTGRTRGSAEAGQRRRGVSDHELIPAAVSIESARETTQRKKLEVGTTDFG